MNNSNAIDTIYDEREKFIIIGLTGRTGSGCTTVSTILQTKNFQKLSLHQPKTTDFDNNDERKYQIIYNYAERHWDPFIRISMTDIIFSFILQYNFDKFMEILKKLTNDKLFNDIEDIINNQYSNLKKEFNDLNKKIDECLNKDGELKRNNKKYENDNNDDINYFEKECDILNRIPKIQESFHNIMSNMVYTYDDSDQSGEDKQEVTANAFTYCLQEFGNRIRHHGDINEGQVFISKHMFALAERANGFIKALRFKNTNDSKPTFICLDAIRNPYEATYFQDRYASFFLVAVSTDDDERIRRLGVNYTNQQIQAMDKTEYPQKNRGNKRFTNQDIGACAQLADIYLYNPHEDTDEKFFISELIVKYVTLIKHPGLITPSSVERCMQIAYNAKLNSGCLSRQVGAVITDANYSVKAIGWNSVAENQVPCNLRSVDNYLNNKDRGSFSKYEIEDTKFNNLIEEKYSKFTARNNKGDIDLKGRLYSYCFKDEYKDITKENNQVHTRSLHAEENAFLQIVKYGGQGIEGGNLFTSASSCVLCSKKAFQLGIKHIYYIDPYPDIADSHILSFGKDESMCPQCHLFYGAIGRAYTCLFTQRIAIKDELEYFNPPKSKKLVVYFSVSNVTEKAAETLAKAVDADIYEIKTEVSDKSSEHERQNQNSENSAGMKNKMSRSVAVGENIKIDEYNVIFVGFPICRDMTPTIISTFLEQYDFSEKIIIFFATSNNAEFVDTVNGLKEIVSERAIIKEGKILNGNPSVDELKKWVESLGI